jgi:hypothetical protein
MFLSVPMARAASRLNLLSKNHREQKTACGIPHGQGVSPQLEVCPASLESEI